jgi:D-arabinose 1-dehydrogenase-like Zn-dependent alcohol dehydrogenase
MVQFVKDNNIKPVVDKVFNFENVQEASERMDKI